MYEYSETSLIKDAGKEDKPRDNLCIYTAYKMGGQKPGARVLSRSTQVSMYHLLYTIVYTVGEWIVQSLLGMGQGR